MNKSILLIAILTLAFSGAATAHDEEVSDSMDPELSVTMGNYGASVSTKYGSVTASTTGATVDNREFKVSGVACLKADGKIVEAFNYFGSPGRLIGTIVSCK